MNNQNFCQSCGMPVSEKKFMGTETDGTLTEEFCTYCFQKGSFVQDVSLEEMIEICVPHLVQSGMNEKQARDHMAGVLPNLGRWK